MNTGLGFVLFFLSKLQLYIYHLSLLVFILSDQHSNPMTNSCSGIFIH